MSTDSTQRQILRILEEGPQINARIAELLGYHPSWTVRVLHGMQDAGLVVREPVEQCIRWAVAGAPLPEDWGVRHPVRRSTYSAACVYADRVLADLSEGPATVGTLARSAGRSVKVIQRTLYTLEAQGKVRRAGFDPHRVRRCPLWEAVV